MTRSVDVTLIGGGIMSATLGVLLQRVRPDWSIQAFERLDQVGLESSGPWNNAGTGHASLCELNYSPQLPDGSIDASKAFTIAEQFQVSRQFWASLVRDGQLPDPGSFIRSIPHMSYVQGQDDVEFLRRRHDAISRNALLASVYLTEDLSDMQSWAPVMFEGRSLDEPVAMTRSDDGTDVNFGKLSRLLFDAMQASGGEMALGHEVTNLEQLPDGRWRVDVRDINLGATFSSVSRFVFIGAGGHAVTLLQQSGIKEAKGYGGFPVGGQFLRCTNPGLVAAHRAKVYGKSTADAPPMAMPHLDTRFVNGKEGLLFGPYAGFSPKFLKRGSWLDLIRSVRPDNLLTMLAVARNEFALSRFLVRQVLQAHEDRIEALRNFVPPARPEDWELIHAGQRVQIMKRVKGRGKLVFGTEVVHSADGTIAALLGASPGASVSPAIMLDVMERCFPREFPAWKSPLRHLVPSLGETLADKQLLYEEIQEFTTRELGLAAGSQARAELGAGAH